MAIFSLLSNSLVSNFNGFCMVLEYVRNEEFNDFLYIGFLIIDFFDGI